MTEIVDKDTGEIIEAAENADPTLKEMITTYIALRDKKAAIVKEQKEVLKPYNDAMEEISLYLKDWLAEQKVNAISCGTGTAYVKGVRSATIGDTGAFREYVISNNNFDLAHFTANKDAVEDYIKEHDGQPPPGTNFRVFHQVFVNRK